MTRTLGPRQQMVLEGIHHDKGRLVVMNSWRGQVWASVTCVDYSADCKWCGGYGTLRLSANELDSILKALPLHEVDRRSHSTTYQLVEKEVS